MKPYVNRITELLGIQYPIIQGGMRWVARAELAAAVGNAGGLGFISAHTHASADALAREIDRVRSLTDKPFGVNLTVLGANVGLDYDAYVRTIVSQGVQVVETAGSNPAKYIAEFKAQGVKVVHKCVTVRHAVKAESLGADAVSIDGFECAGHPGEDDIPGLILIPAAADKLKVPILASGGFADGRGLMAALALGADGINMGTRFMLTQESPVHPAIKQRLLEASERDTVLVGRSIGDSSRVVRNSVSLAALELERAGNVTRSDLYALIGAQRWMDAFVTGEVEGGAFPAGIVTGLIHDLPTCAELIGRIVKEAAAIAQRQLGFSAALA
ncbi:nitronate monooxygenase [Paraburkholderia sp. CI2]|uniref:NAD(P)H-dependent flavin oxidoreductase n=1 Tax=Paraburkholderia sp. CI2 TaxID=2723093 RepID=UPI00161C2DA7|nr:nitronate monooxygenase [Paraburkholderia sp. CI2]MBB5465143.1 nitronate monooxygenase [Paraburkholderia sp. CI2]